MKKFILIFMFITLTQVAPIHAMSLEEAIENKDRTSENMARDKYRHPKEVLTFFGIKSDTSVIELWPSRGWWSEILAPLLAAEGNYVGAGLDPNYASWTPKVIKRNADIRANSKTFSDMKVITLSLDNKPLGEKNSVDMVLTFRNLHNWLNAELLMDVFNKS